MTTAAPTTSTKAITTPSSSPPLQKGNTTHKPKAPVGSVASGILSFLEKVKSDSRTAWDLFSMGYKAAETKENVKRKLVESYQNLKNWVFITLGGNTATPETEENRDQLFSESHINVTPAPLIQSSASTYIVNNHDIRQKWTAFDPFSDTSPYQLTQNTTSGVVCVIDNSYVSRNTVPYNVAHNSGRCPSAGQIPDHQVKCENLEITTPSWAPKKILTVYHTLGEPIIKNCVIRHVNEPCVIYSDKTYQWSTTDSSGNKRPVSHFVVDLSDDRNIQCEICTGCLTKGRQISPGIWETKCQTPCILMGGLFRRSSRSLLAHKSVKRQSGKLSKCASPGALIPFKRGKVVPDSEGSPHEKLTFCNGTLMTSLPLKRMHGCFTVAKVKSHYQCIPPFHNSVGNCSTGPDLVDCGSNRKCLKVLVGGHGMVKVSRGSTTVVKRCDRECTFEVPDEKGPVTVVCPDASQHLFEDGIVDVDCKIYFGYTRLSLYICRITHRPALIYFLIVWNIIGFPLLLFGFTLSRQLLVLLGMCIRWYRSRKDPFVVCKCEHCGRTLESEVEQSLHKKFCPLGHCPYCESVCTKSSLSRHTKNCYKKTELRDCIKQHRDSILIPQLLRWVISRLHCWNRMISKTTWVAVFFICFLLLVAPVRGFHTVDPTKDTWEQEIDFINFCGQECTLSEDSCTCPIVTKEEEEIQPGRKLLSIPSLSGHSTLNKHIKMYRTANIDSPWGLLRVEDTYKPSRSASDISLSWDSQEHVGDKIILSGKSTAVLKLVEKTGAVWKLQSKEAVEERTLTVSILDYAQVYGTEFIYLTGDREVGDWSHGACTGNCPGNCGCTDPTCFQKQWLHSRNWRCNPTWCWGVGTGCTCCAVDVRAPFKNYAVSKWKTDYVETQVAACVELTGQERICELVSAGVTLTIGPISVSFSDPGNIQNRLPDEILVMNDLGKEDKGGMIDFLHPDRVLSANNLCKLQSCSHGSAGDFQVYHIDNVVKNDITNYNYLKDGLSHLKTSWMSWQGVNLDYYCNPGAWPTCISSGVVRDNTEAFKNLEKAEIDLSKKMHFHSNRIFGNGSVFTMDLKTRPLYGGGEVTVYIDVKGLELHSSKIVLKGLRLGQASCSGCFGCTSGFTCEVKVFIVEPDEFTVHLKSLTPEAVIAETSIVARHPDAAEPVLTTVKGFSAVDLPEICLAIKEGKLCPDCPKEDTKLCTSLKLKAPTQILLEHRGTIKSKANETCGNSTLECWGNGFKSFFGGVGSFFSNYFGGILEGILAVLLPAGLIILAILFGPQLLSFLRVLKVKKSASLLLESQGDKNSQDGDISSQKNRMMEIMARLPKSDLEVLKMFQTKKQK
nr:MAG: glycoprotein [Gubbo nairovirus]